MHVHVLAPTARCSLGSVCSGILPQRSEVPLVQLLGGFPPPFAAFIQHFRIDEQRVNRVALCDPVDSACNGVCTTCSGTGICRAPATDSSCATGLCASPGVCEEPAVTCGSENCSLSSDVCCSEFAASGNTRLFCEEGASAYPPPPASIPDIPIRCDEPSDCPSSRVCCYAGTSTSGEVACKLPNPSPAADESSLDFESFPCPAFENCESENDRLPGFVFCR